MNREGHDNVKFFVGPEVEHTPAYSKRTLFVVGKQDADQIERMAREYKTPHIFMGANHSFTVDQHDWNYWDSIITSLLDKGFWVTLDYPAHQHEQMLKLLNPGIWQSRLFVPLLSVRIPHVQTSSTNLTIKIDDVDFKSTNAGVWCLNHHEITDSNRFTDWQDYGSDVVIRSEVYLEIEQPKIDLAKVREIVEKKQTAHIDSSAEVMLASLEARKSEEGTVKNDKTLGLDPDAKSVLKDENEEEASLQTNVSANVDSPAAAPPDAAPAPAKTRKESTKKAESKA